MGVFAGPEIVEDGLVLALDAGNLKSYDKYENLLTDSEDFSTTSTWIRNNYDVSTNVITAPDGTLTADKIIPINSDTFHDVYKSPALSSGTYTFSIFAKAAEQSFIRLRIDTSTLSRIAVFNVSNGTLITSLNITSSSIIPYPNGWYRCSITITDNIINAVINGFPTSSTGNYSGDGTSGLYIWGAQLERGESLTDYYATTGTAKTRGSVISSGIGTLTGTLTNGVGYNSFNGGSFTFDGVDDYVIPSDISSNSFWQGNWTASFWANFNTIGVGTTGAGDQPLFSHGTNSPRQGLHLVQRNNGLMHFGLYYDDLQGTVGLSSNTWYNIVFTLNNETFRKEIYINGTLDNTHVGVGSYVGIATAQFPYGAMGTKVFDRDAFLNYFDGKMASCKFYDRVLSSNEIQQNYNATRGRYGI